MTSKTPHRYAGLLLAACLISCLALGVSGLAQTKPVSRDNPLPASRPIEREAALTDKQVETVLELVSTSRPALAQRLRQLKQSDPQAFHKAVRRMAAQERTRRFLALQESDPEGFDVRIAEWRAADEANHLAHALRKAKTPEEIEKLKPRLRAAVEQQFDARLKVRERELARLEKRLVQLRDNLRQTQARREKMIEEQYQKSLAAPAEKRQ